MARNKHTLLLLFLLAVVVVVCVCVRTNDRSDSFELENSPKPVAQKDTKKRSTVEYNLEASLLGKVNILLTWDEQEGADGYSIYRANGEDGSFSFLSAVNRCEYKDSFMDTGDMYSYHVTMFTLGDTGDKLYGKTSDPVSIALPEYNGFFNLDGVLYCYEDGVLLRDSTANNLYFDINGQYTSGHPQLDEYVRKITASCTNENMSQLRKFRALYDWVIDECEYEAIEYVDEVPGWEKDAALEMFKTGYGNCFSYAAAVAVLGRNVGLDANAVTGDCNQTYLWLYHGWTEVNYGGKTYMCDAEMEGEFAPVRDLDWDLFMKEYGTTPTLYEKYEPDVEEN